MVTKLNHADCYSKKLAVIYYVLPCYFFFCTLFFPEQEMLWWAFNTAGFHLSCHLVSPSVCLSHVA